MRYLRPIGTLVLGALVHLMLVVVPPMVCRDVSPSLLGRADIVLFALLLTGFFLVESMAALFVGHRCPEASRYTWLPYASSLILLLLFWAGLWDFSADRPFHLGTTFFACLCFAIGVLLRNLAIRNLRHLFLDAVGLRSEHQLVQSGIYAHLRHPSETGLLLIACGAALLLRSPLSLAILVSLLIPLTLFRIRAEDSLLASRFQGAFHAYCQRTPALWPRRCSLKQRA